MVNLPSPIEELHHPILEENRITLYVKRDDLIHPQIMGNKWRKLKFNLVEAKSQNKESLLTLGGAFSNHIYATAAAGELLGLKTIGIIRGDELSASSNTTLKFAASKGMELKFMSREMYRGLREDPTELYKRYPDSYFLPEGGTNQHAIQGCTEMVAEIEVDFDLIALPIGTGGTFCGVLAGVTPSQHVLGISSLKGDFIKQEIKGLMNKFQIDNPNFQINCNYHFGGYAKTARPLIDFIDWFKETFGIELDPIYTGKTFFAVWDMIKSQKFEENLRIVLLHTGGLRPVEGL